MPRSVYPFLLAVLAVLPGQSTSAQTPENADVRTVYTYADVADLTLAAGITAQVKIRKAKKLSKALALGVAPGAVRYLVSAELIALIRSSGPLSPRLSYIVDLPTDSRGRTETIAKREMFIFAAPSRPGEVRLIKPDAQMPATPEGGVMLRRILSEATRPGAPAAIAGVGAAFHTEGALPGEGETQIFLGASGENPMSFSIIRKTDAPVRWFVSSGEIVDESAGVPARNTLLWYRLACFLPPQMTAADLADHSPEEAAIIAADYKLVMADLGPCRRARIRQSS
jgi:hypothetical protein